MSLTARAGHWLYDRASDIHWALAHGEGIGHAQATISHNLPPFVLGNNQTTDLANELLEASVGEHPPAEVANLLERIWQLVEHMARRMPRCSSSVGSSGL